VAGFVVVAFGALLLACSESSIVFIFSRKVKWFRLGDIDFDLTVPGTREFVSLAASLEEFDEVCIQFESVDPSQGTAKRFTVATQPTLYSHYGLVKYWGRAGEWSRMRIEEYRSPKELDERIFETAKQRLAHGYHIRPLQGPRHYKVLMRIVEFAKQKHEYCPAPTFS